MNIYLFRRLLLFVLSLFINAVGIAFITKGSLGTSPITSVNYVLSMFTSLTMGQWTIIVNILFVFLELPLMRRKDLKEDLRIFLLQIPVSDLFGQGRWRQIFRRIWIFESSQAIQMAAREYSAQRTSPAPPL